MNLHDVHQGVSKYRRTKRLGRGIGSGQGKTSGRGHKGQFSVSGSSHKPAFQGGQMPLVRKIPKRGFTNEFARSVATINVADLETHFQAGEEVSPVSLKAKSLIRWRYDELKILGNGDLSKPLKVVAHKLSQSAKEKIEKAGGSIEILSGPKPVVRNKSKKAAKSR